MNNLCAGYKAFFTHVDQPMRLMANLLRQGRFADEIMSLYDGEETAKLTKVGRNEPCPCGSGKEYKRRHGRREKIETKTI